MRIGIHDIVTAAGYCNRLSTNDRQREALLVLFLAQNETACIVGVRLCLRYRDVGCQNGQFLAVTRTGNYRNGTQRQNDGIFGCQCRSVGYFAEHLCGYYVNRDLRTLVRDSSGDDRIACCYRTYQTVGINGSYRFIIRAIGDSVLLGSLRRINCRIQLQRRTKRHVGLSRQGDAVNSHSYYMNRTCLFYLTDSSGDLRVAQTHSGDNAVLVHFGDIRISACPSGTLACISRNEGRNRQGLLSADVQRRFCFRQREIGDGRFGDRQRHTRAYARYAHRGGGYRYRSRHTFRG